MNQNISNYSLNLCQYYSFQRERNQIKLSPFKQRTHYTLKYYDPESWCFRSIGTAAWLDIISIALIIEIVIITCDKLFPT